MAITIDRETAEKLYDLYNNIVAADAHYKRCQGDNFRMHVKSVYQAKTVESAFEALKAQLDKQEEIEDEPTAFRKGRRSVLTDD